MSERRAASVARLKAKPPILRTIDIATAVGVHVNTVRVYEQWGFLPPVPRASNGYRLYTPFHLDQMRLARTALHGGWPGRAIRRSALALVRQSASGDVRGALKQARQHLILVQAERAQAEAAADYLEKWAFGELDDEPTTPLQIGEAAELLDVSTDMLRNWERNGLIKVPRERGNRYRLYGSIELGRLRVLRLLYRAGYSSMAILRMVHQLDRGQRANLRRALDTPPPDEDILTTADRWLSTLAEQEQRAHDMICQLQKMTRR
ncbi:MAG: MerR family DNA-binding transcriptional regulator [Thermoflexales bacterium]|nr:MerR family DNA-binding transcriptional regulator [Thermoflexales bacterium]